MWRGKSNNCLLLGNARVLCLMAWRRQDGGTRSHEYALTVFTSCDDSAQEAPLRCRRFGHGEPVSVPLFVPRVWSFRSETRA
jgi:hypothetical protein